MLERDDQEHRIPPPLRPIFDQVVDTFLKGDFLLRAHPIEGVTPVDPVIAEAIVDTIRAYGAELAPLHEATWESSCYRWMDGYWQVLVDITTTSEQVSDLTLFARVHDESPLLLEIQSVHVP